MNEKKEESGYWFRLSDQKYSEAMTLLELSDEYYQKGIAILKPKRKED
jgi:hypothetical protein